MSILSCLKKVSKSFLVTITSIFLLISPTSAIYALDESLLDFYAENNIFFYDPDDSMGLKNNCFIGTGDEITNISKAAIIIWNKLNTFLTPEQAAGVMGNMQHESHLNPAQHEISLLEQYPNFDIENNSSISYGVGLIQWSYGRRTNMIKAIKNKKPNLLKYLKNPSEYSIGYTIDGQALLEKIGEKDFTDLVDIQIDYLKQEIENSDIYGGIKKQKNVIEASDYFLKYIEVPADIPGQIPIRRDSSKTFYKISSGCGGLKSGGMNLEEAKKFMEIYRNATINNSAKRYDLTLSATGIIRSANETNNQDPLVQAPSGGACKDGTLSNCSAFTQWFLNTYTSLGPQSVGLRQGSMAVQNYISEHGLIDGKNIPKVYSVMSMGPFDTCINEDGFDYCNHTGIVLGIDEKNDKIIIGEASCLGIFPTIPGANEYPLSKMTKTGKEYYAKYAYTDNVLKSIIKKDK